MNWRTYCTPHQYSFTVRGIGSVEDVNVLLKNGADKISVNTAASKPELINEFKELAASA